jgi:MFS transporter, ACS family, D-galactonate transporter
MNFFNNMMGVAAPIATGYIAGTTGSFTGAFLAAGIVLVVGIIAFVFILGRLEPIADPPPPGGVDRSRIEWGLGSISDVEEA